MQEQRKKLKAYRKLINESQRRSREDVAVTEINKEMRNRNWDEGKEKMR